MFEYFASSVAFAEAPFSTACAAIKACGIDDIDIWSVAHWCEHLDPHRTELDLVAVRTTLAEHNLRCHAMSVYGASQAVVQARLSQLQELGGQVLVQGAEDGISVVQYAESIRPLADLAQELGVTLAIENHLNTCIDTTASMVKLCERINHPGLGIALAPIHLYRLSEDIPHAIRSLDDRIALFYAWDWGPRAEQDWKNPEDQLPGAGQIDFAPILRALHDIEYPRKLCLFAHGLENRPLHEAQTMLRSGITFCTQIDMQLEKTRRS